MPVRKVKGGYRWGSSGKVYRKKAKASRQGRAVRMSRKSRPKKGARSGTRKY